MGKNNQADLIEALENQVAMTHRDYRKEVWLCRIVGLITFVAVAVFFGIFFDDTLAPYRGQLIIGCAVWFVFVAMRISSWLDALTHARLAMQHAELDLQQTLGKARPQQAT